MWFYTHPACLAHDTGPGHAERPERLTAVVDALRPEYPAGWHEAPRASRAQLQRVHAPALISRVLEAPVAARLQLDADTVLSPASAQAALRAAGAGIAAVDALMSGATRRAFCAVRPPGHHATGETAMGFCLFNNIAVAAAHARDAYGLERIAIADFDVHHGNGTQAIFEADPRVLYASSHQMPLYPGSGLAEEHGAGNVHNAPLPAGAGSTEFRAVWQSRLLPAIDDFRAAVAAGLGRVRCALA